MKKFSGIFVIVVALLLLSCTTVNAQDNNMLYDLSPIYDSVSEDVRRSLDNIGAHSADVNSLSEISLNSIISEITSAAGENMSSPLKGLISVTAVLLLCSMLSVYKNTLSSTVADSLNIAATLCITCCVVMPATAIIKSTGAVIEASSNIMLAYIPIMAVIMCSMGQPLSGASYYTMILAAGQGVAQLSSKVITPLLSMFLGLSVTSSVSPDINLGGFISMISKSIKWLLGFVMTIFTAVLSFKQIITTSLDNVSTRAVRFTLNSFIPVVGSALSDAYKTVQGSVGLLKSGVGIFVILAVAAVFLPVILQCSMWIFTLWIGKSTAEVLSLPQPAKLLDGTASVFSTLLAIILCIMSIYIISTAIVLLAGGGGG